MSSTLAQLTTNIRLTLGDPSSQYYTDGEIYAGIAKAYKNYSLIMLKDGIGYFETHRNLSLVASTEAITTAGWTPPFFSISTLERRVSNGTQPLMSDQRRFRPNITTSTGSGDSYLPTYKIRGTNIILEPAPLSAETVSSLTASTETVGLFLVYNYIPTFPTSTSLSSFAFDDNFPVIYESMVEDYAAIYCLENKDATGGVSDIATVRNRLMGEEAQFLDSLVTDDTPDHVVYSGQDYYMFY